MKLLRVVFLALVVIFALFSFGSDWEEISSTLKKISFEQYLLSIVMVLIGLSATSSLWVRGVKNFGHSISPKSSANYIFFVGQLGKYIPGSVWNIVAQGQMATQHKIPIRVTVVASMFFLYWNFLSSAFYSALIFSQFPEKFFIDIEPLVYFLVMLLSAAGLIPPSVNFLLRLLVGKSHTPHFAWKDLFAGGLLTGITWSCYGLGLFLLSPSFVGRLNFETVLLFTATFAFSYAVGVVTPVSPAGLGVREAILIFLLTPSIGLVTAAAIALAIRLVHTAADFAIASVAWMAKAYSSRAGK